MYDNILVETTKWVEQQQDKANNKLIQPPEAITFVREGETRPSALCLTTR